MMKKKILHLIFITLFIGSVSFSCRQPTSDFDRKNVNDPLNDEYNAGTAGSVTVSFNTDGIILLEWEDNARYEDGYIIEKSLADTTNFIEIGRVEENVTTFQDSSRNVRKNTFYKISPFINRQNGLKKVGSSAIKMNYYGDITTLKHQFSANSKTLDLNWETNSPFVDKYLLEYRLGSSESFTPIQEFEPNTKQYSDELTDISFDDREYRLKILLSGDSYEEVIDRETASFKAGAFFPSELTVEFQNEQTINLNWSDNSYFEEGYKVYRSDPQTEEGYILIGNLDADATHYQDQWDLKDGTNYTYKILGYTPNSESDSLAQQARYSIPTPFLINDRYSNTDNTAIQLSWDIEDDRLVNEYILERKQGSLDQWNQIGRFDKLVNNYTDSDVDQSSGHSYRIRTISSDYSDKLSLHFRPIFNLITSFIDHSRPISDLDFTSDNNYLISSSNEALGYGDTYINIWDIDSNTLFQKIEGFHSEPLTSVDFSPDGTMFSSSSWFDFTVNIFEFPSGKLIRSFSKVDAYEAEFSPDSKYIAATGGFADVRKWEINSGNLIFHYEGRGSPTSTPHSIAFNSDGTEIAVDDKSMAVLDAMTGERIKHLDTDYNYSYLDHSVNYSSDGSRLAYTLNRLEVFRTESWTLLFQSPYGQDQNLYPTFNPNDNSIVAVAGGQSIKFKNIDNGLTVNKLTVSDKVSYFTYSPDGSLIATGLDNGNIEVWEETGQKGWKEVY